MAKGCANWLNWRSRPSRDESEADDDAAGPRVAIAGRPNVGKSTFVNTLLGEERVIAFDMPGTTRDAIEVPFERNGRAYTLIDTAGLRRRGRVFETIEKFSVIKTLQAVEEANVVVLMVDATQEISDQDAHIAGFAIDAGRAMVVAVNKWDAVDDYRREQIKLDVARKLNFLGFARVHYVSALKGQGIAGILGSVDKAYAAAMAKMTTPKLTRVLIAAVEKQTPPRHGAFRPKLRYAHQGGSNPPIIVIHGNALEHMCRRPIPAFLNATFSMPSSFRARRCAFNTRPARIPLPLMAGRRRQSSGVEK
jgi:GTP-binding protein